MKIAKPVTRGAIMARMPMTMTAIVLGERLDERVTWGVGGGVALRDGLLTEVGVRVLDREGVDEEEEVVVVELAAW